MRYQTRPHRPDLSSDRASSLPVRRPKHRYQHPYGHPYAAARARSGPRQAPHAPSSRQMTLSGRVASPMCSKPRPTSIRSRSMPNTARAFGGVASSYRRSGRKPAARAFERPDRCDRHRARPAAPHGEPDRVCGNRWPRGTDHTSARHRDLTAAPPVVRSGPVRLGRNPGRVLAKQLIAKDRGEPLLKLVRRPAALDHQLAVELLVAEGPQQVRRRLRRQASHER